MSGIFGYELKKLIFSKLFLSLALITGLYSYFTLSRKIITGIAFTAPFSPWSYGAYLANIMPLLVITLLFFVSIMYSKQEKQVKQITFTTPVDPVKYGFVKCAAITTGFLIISLFVILISMAFFVILFRFYNFGNFIIPIVITLIPGMLFILGAGLLLGGIHTNILYILMIAALLFGFLSPPAFFDLYGGSFFSAYPLTLSVGLDGEPPFALPISFISGRVFFSTAGILMVLLGIKRYKTKNLFVARV